jgi:hypothetical protein
VSVAPGFDHDVMPSLISNMPTLLVILGSIVLGMLMVIVFRYTSNQKDIRAAKDRLKAHLLAFRLFQDQISVVMRSYPRMLLAIGRYLRVGSAPLLVVIVPVTFLVAELDHYFGSLPIRSGQAFLVKAQASNAGALNRLSLQLPIGLNATAPAVHVYAKNEVAWRLVAAKDGNYRIEIEVAGQAFSKSLVVGSGLPRLSRIRCRGFWERMFLSAEPPLPDNSSVESIEVLYPNRTISVAGIESNWIWFLFVVSLAAGFFFKSILGVEI